MNSDHRVVRNALRASVQAPTVRSAVAAALAAYTTPPTVWPLKGRRNEDRRDPLWRALAKHLMSVLLQSDWSVDSPYPPEWGFPVGAIVEALRTSKSVDPQAPEFLPLIGTILDVPCAHWKLPGSQVYPVFVLGLDMAGTKPAIGTAPMQRCWEIYLPDDDKIEWVTESALLGWGTDQSARPRHWDLVLAPPAPVNRPTNETPAAPSVVALEVEAPADGPSDPEPMEVDDPEITPNPCRYAFIGLNLKHPGIPGAVAAIRKFFKTARPLGLQAQRPQSLQILRITATTPLPQDDGRVASRSVVIAELVPADVRILERQKKLLGAKCKVSVHPYMSVQDRRKEEMARVEQPTPPGSAPTPQRHRKRRRGAQGVVDHSE